MKTTAASVAAVLALALAGAAIAARPVATATPPNTKSTK
jgi:hypothetical protein